MATHTVRLEPEAERALREIQQSAGMTVSTALKQGLLVLRDRLRSEASGSPYQVYRELDLGPGGYARFPARRAKHGIQKILRRKRAP
jgi:hypothetical protein